LIVTFAVLEWFEIHVACGTAPLFHLFLKINSAALWTHEFVIFFIFLFDVRADRPESVNPNANSYSS